MRHVAVALCAPRPDGRQAGQAIRRRQVRPGRVEIRRGHPGLDRKRHAGRDRAVRRTGDEAEQGAAARQDRGVHEGSGLGRQVPGHAQAGGVLVFDVPEGQPGRDRGGGQGVRRGQERLGPVSRYARRGQARRLLDGRGPAGPEHDGGAAVRPQPRLAGPPRPAGILARHGLQAGNEEGVRVGRPADADRRAERAERIRAGPEHQRDHGDEGRVEGVRRRRYADAAAVPTDPGDVSPRSTRPRSS